jgi:predicted DNA-binding transcriptional regulator
MGLRSNSRGFQVTDRDLAIVRWIARQRFAEAQQIARRFAMDERNAYRRLRGLTTRGLLAQEWVLHGRPGVYFATRDGLAAIELALPPARIDLRTFVHDLGTAALAIELEREFGADALVTERELRSIDTTAEQPRYAVMRGNQTTRRGLHFPDLAVEQPDSRPLAIELELTAKGRGRLDQIVAAYVRGRHIAAVRYYAAPAALPAVQRAVARAGADQLIHIHPTEVP